MSSDGIDCDESSTPIDAIAGGVGGAVVILVAIIVTVVLIKRKGRFANAVVMEFF